MSSERVKNSLAGESVWQDAHPNSDGGGIDSFVLVVLAALLLLEPAETDEVDARTSDVSLVEEYNTLETDVSPQIPAC